MELGLANRKAIISGGNRGIGRTIAQFLAREGVHVALLGRNEHRFHIPNARTRRA